MGINNYGSCDVSANGQTMMINITNVGLYKSTNYGVTWNLINANTTNRWHQVRFK